MQWTEELYIHHPELYLPVMDGLKETAAVEARQIHEGIFKEFHANDHLKVLDLCCGIGTHALALASTGHEVVGYDFSPHCIARAKKGANDQGLDEKKIRFYQGDIREVSHFLSQNQEKDFDAILNLGTAHGYYGEMEDRKLFKNLLSFAYANCLLIVNTVNRDWIAKYGTSYGFSVIKGTKVQIEQKRNLNLQTSTMENVWNYYEILPQRNVKHLLTLHVNHRIYSPHELTTLLSNAAWDHLKSYGSLEKLEPVGPTSFKMTLVSKRAR